MTRIEKLTYQPIFQSLQVKPTEVHEEKEESKKVQIKENNTVVVSSTVALDILEGNSNNTANSTSEKFRDVIEEMRKNVPDSTSTIEEKELAISYIDRMLACDDIPNPEYWQNKKDIIEMEIQTIKNEKKGGTGENVSDVWKEVEDFINKYKKSIDKNLSEDDKLEYYTTYHNTCISFYNRLLQCRDLTREQKDEYERMIHEHENDISGINGFSKYSDWNPILKVANTIEDLPKGSHDNIRDARGYDISGLNLTIEELLNLTIDKTTVLSEEQQKILNKYIEKMKDPGLGIRDLHEQGITGKGVKMAIIDSPIGYHQEYGSNVIGYYDINCEELGFPESSMHGAAVASIAVGENTGVAPDADLVYYAAYNMTNDPAEVEQYKSNLLAEIAKYEEIEGYEHYVNELKETLKNIEEHGGTHAPTNKYHAEAINRILDENEKLPPEERVTVISISWGFDKLAPGYDELIQAIQRAKEQGVFIVSTALDEHYGFNTCGANRNPQGDANDPNDYEAGAFWKDYNGALIGDQNTLLLFPMDHRTVADFTDGNSYRYEGNDGGMSWSTPWIAGLYVLAKQVDFDITPEEFWELALATSNECHNNDNGEYVGRIVNPQKLIQAIQERKEQKNT